MFSVFIFLFGLIIGSFLNAVIYRLNTQESILVARSHCPKCRAVLKWYDLIPLLSFIFQKGRCRYCSKNISWQYPLVELSTGLLFLLMAYQVLNLEFGIWDLFRNLKLEIRNLLLLIYWFYIISVLIIIFVYDLKHYIIPDKVLLPAIIISLIWSLVISHYLEIRNLKLEIEDFRPLLAALGASSFFLLLVILSSGKWMGLGDVKLAVLMGLVLGWPNILWALFLAFLSGAIIGLVLIAFKIKTLKSQIPFGPFLSGATILVMLFGESLTKVFNWFILF